MEKNEIYFFIAISCGDCNEQSACVFDHKPTEEEKKDIVEEMGGMFCIKTYTKRIDKLNVSISLKESD
jgi:ribosomal protein S27E